jgi:hypothetical protein
VTDIIQPEVFNFMEQPKAANWLVKDVIPLGHLCILLAPSGKGKSFIMEYLAMCVASGKDFLGFDTIASDVLLIDQDTPEPVLKQRLFRMAHAMGGKPKYQLYLSSMQGLSLANGSLIHFIKSSSAKLVIIDSLHSICGRLNPNKTEDMSRWATVKGECLVDNKTIFMSHHITEKLDYSLKELMDGNTHISGMGSSAIRQQTDTEYIMTSDVADGKIDKLYMRPVAKRAPVSQKPLIMKLIEPDDSSFFLEFAGYFEPDMDDVEEDIYLLMQQREMDFTVKEIIEGMGHKHGDKAVRESLTSLEVKGKVIMSRNKSNLFKYRLPKIG